MHIKQTNDFSVHIKQDTKSIKNLPPGEDFLKEEEKQGILKSLVGQLLYLDLTRPDLTFLISDLARSSSKTSDERLRVARVLLQQVREPAKSIVYRPTGKSTMTCAVTLTLAITRPQILVLSLTLEVQSVS